MAFVSSSHSLTPISPSTSPFPTPVSPRSPLNFTSTQRRRPVSCSVATPTPPPASSSSLPLPPPPPHISCEESLQSAIAESFITVVKVYSKSCRSCKRIERPYIRMSDKYKQQGIKCLQLCSEHNQQLAQSLGVRGFPTFIFYKNGKRVDHIASNNSHLLEQSIEDLL